MKDITRIHIAKVSYDVELAAKKTLETYINALEVYAQDTEVLEDIEIRITELLLERGVKQNDVIAMTDVAAIKKQLGDPKEFMADGDVIAADVETGVVKKKLYRNTDTAIIGGVLSGCASYFGIDPLLTRFIFIILSFISFGATLFLYLLFWVLLPAAKTATEKLQMSGQPVTIAAIRQLNEGAVTPNKTPATIRRIATILLGLGSVIAALTVLGAIVYGAIATYTRPATEMGGIQSIHESLGVTYLLTLSLALAASVLLVALFLLVAFAAFKQIFTRRIWITGLVIIVLGLASFGGVLVSGFYGAGQREAEITKRTTTRAMALPVGFENVTALKLQGITHSAIVQYVVSNDRRAQITTPRNETASLSIEGTQLALRYTQNETSSRLNGYRATITIYGPALTSIEADATSLQYDSRSQAELSVTVKDGGDVSIKNSRIQLLKLTLESGSQFDSQSAAVNNVVVHIRDVSSLRLGAVESLSITAPAACAANDKNDIHAAAVNDKFVTYNDTKMIEADFEDSCTATYSHGDPVYGTSDAR